MSPLTVPQETEGEPSKKARGIGYIEGRPFKSLKNGWCPPNGEIQLPQTTANKPEEVSNPIGDILTIEDLLRSEEDVDVNQNSNEHTEPSDDDEDEPREVD